MSVEPWIDACPRSARIPPPGRPMFPSRSWTIDAVRMYCTPTVCGVPALARGAGGFHPFVLPGRVVVLLLLRIPAGKEAVEVLCVLELLVDDHRRVRERLDVLVEPALVLEDVVDDPAEERDVAAGPDRDVQVRHRARAREPRVDVDQLRAAAAGLHRPLEADGMILRHVRAHDHDAVRVGQVLLEVRRPASPE